MNRNTALLLGIGAAGVFAYAVWCAFDQTLAGMEAMDDSGDRRLNEEIEDSFPASDAPSHTPVMGGLAGRS
jgi:hypothetical protein